MTHLETEAATAGAAISAALTADVAAVAGAVTAEAHQAVADSVAVAHGRIDGVNAEVDAAQLVLGAGLGERDVRRQRASHGGKEQRRHVNLS